MTTDFIEGAGLASGAGTPGPILLVPGRNTPANGITGVSGGTFDVQDEIKCEIEGITLSTIHAAKGLEWPAVIVAGCNEGIIPARPNDQDEIEGERRLMYVAMTRAMDQLMLTVRPTESTDAAGRVHKSPESRFIMDLQGDR